VALIRQVNPDVVALQETDSTRISLNNNDIVRYYANKLGYYSYYGPKTVTGTYGTALLSKYPLKIPLTFFTFSDKDEAGTVEAEIVVGDQTFTVFSVHPDESDPAMLVFAKTLLRRAQEKPQVIAMGDYNLRSYEEAYQVIDRVLKNAWTSVYPTGIDNNGLDMSGENRIDHIFVSPSLQTSDPVYLLPPESGTDHPAHWATISP
jgi:endonuclease/exonuclease/phosphatase family metal-dependent hydrolase